MDTQSLSESRSTNNEVDLIQQLRSIYNERKLVLKVATLTFIILSGLLCVKQTYDIVYTAPVEVIVAADSPVEKNEDHYKYISNLNFNIFLPILKILLAPTIPANSKEFKMMVESFDRNIHSSIIGDLKKAIELQEILYSESFTSKVKEIYYYTAKLIVFNESFKKEPLIKNHIDKEFKTFNIDDSLLQFHTTRTKYLKIPTDDHLSKILKDLLNFEFKLNIFNSFQSEPSNKIKNLEYLEYIKSSLNLIANYYTIYFSIIKKLNMAVFNQTEFASYITPTWLFANSKNLFDPLNNTKKYDQWLAFESKDEAAYLSHTPLNELNGAQQVIAKNYIASLALAVQKQNASKITHHIKTQRKFFDLKFVKQLFILSLFCISLGICSVFLREYLEEKKFKYTGNTLNTSRS